MVLGIPLTGQIQQFLSQYFTYYTGFYGLLALIPLAIFYLTRPKPKRMTMPSMMFFEKNKKAGKLQQAIRYLQSNLILLLNILFIILLAAALAQPVMPTGNTSDHVVSVIDVSASMEDDMEEAKEFLNSRLGQENTIIQVGADIQVPMEKVSASQAESYINSLEAEDTETDIATALETSSNYPGDVHIASDLDQTISDKDVREVLTSLQSQGRTLSVMDSQDTNQWGIVDISVGDGNATAEVKNFLDERAEIQVTAGKYGETLDVASGEVNSVTFPVKPGRNTLELEEDPVTSDNKAYISVPSEEKFKLAFISNQGKFHFEKAVELIDFMEIETYKPPVQKNIEADIYVIGETEDLLSTTVDNIKDNVRTGGNSLIVFNQPGILGRFGDMPVTLKSGAFNGSVEIREPQRIWINNVRIPKIKKTRGDSLATENAVVKSNYGEGQVVFYGLAGTEFKYDFLYPVFWKHLFQDLTDRPTIDQLNLKTGERIERAVEGPGGDQKENFRIRKTGFYQGEDRTYAANLLSEDESNPEGVDFNPEKRAKEGTGERSIQHYVAILLIGVALLEFLYLLYGGVL